MTTPYTDVFDLFLQQVEDYRLNDLFYISETDLNTYLTGFMLLAIPEFTGCAQDLSDRDEGRMQFNPTLTDEVKKILSKLMVKEWLGKEVKDVLQMRWNITDSDFKHFSEAQNLLAKQTVLRELAEECSALLTAYAYSHNNWENWLDGNFMGG